MPPALMRKPPFWKVPVSVSTKDAQGAGPSTESPLTSPLPPPTKHESVKLKGKGLGADDLQAANDEIRAAIDALGCLLEGQPMLELRVAESENDLLDALKLYRDMNHLSLAGGITCDQVVEHVLSHTVLLLYRPEPSQPFIPVTAATFNMRQGTMMLRLLATHPRMTRKGFGRITVHFLKELCRALHKTDILVYTYPSSSPFYKALNFRHTHQGQQAKPKVAPDGANPDAREASREARRVYSAKENEMIFYVQPSMAQILMEISRKDGAASAAAHPYACTRRRAAGQEDERHQAGQPRPPASGTYIAPPLQPAPTMPPPSLREVREVPAHKKAAAAIAAATSASIVRGNRAKERAEARDERQGIKRAAGEAGGSGGGSGHRGPGRPRKDESQLTPQQQEQRRQQLQAQWQGSVEELYTPCSALANGDDECSPRKRPRKDEYAVEKIVDVQRSDTDPSDVKYMIKWKGWPAKYNTWEPLGHLQNLQIEIEAFESSRANGKA